MLRPVKRRLEATLNILLEEIDPGVRIRFAELDVTALTDDASWDEAMLEHGMYRPEEVRGLVEGR